MLVNPRKYGSYIMGTPTEDLARRRTLCVGSVANLGTIAQDAQIKSGVSQLVPVVQEFRVERDVMVAGVDMNGVRNVRNVCRGKHIKGVPARYMIEAHPTIVVIMETIEATEATREDLEENAPVEI